jgi:two-component system phosphate regulon sensor histidine kinase PhoR
MFEARATGRREFISEPLKFAYMDWFLGARDVCATPEELAHINFKFNAFWTGGVAIALIAAMFLAIQATARQMKLSQMKSDFVSNVSHELRTPLSSIRVFGEYMRLGRVEKPEKIREYGEYIEAESRRLTQLINNILDFSRIESAEKKYRFNECDPGAIVTDTVAAFEVPLRERGFNISVDIAPSLPRVCLDRESIAQALVNLIDNAVKYSGDRKEIEVRAFADGDELRIVIQDHGIGIAASEQKKIFEKFYRVGSGLVHDVKGSGLGLAIVSHIVKAHRGRVEVASAPGEGTRFTIVIPCKASEEERGQAGAPVPPLDKNLENA